MIEGSWSLKFHSEKMSFESPDKIFEDTFILLVQESEGFLFACDKEYDLQFISGWEASSLEENVK